jgi:hypothetical protein
MARVGYRIKRMANGASSLDDLLAGSLGQCWLLILASARKYVADNSQAGQQ